MQLTIFCDLDGVLADFENGYSRKFGVSFHDIPQKEAWENVDKHPEMWYEFDPFPGAVKFFQNLRYITNDVMILTSLPHTPETCFGPSAYYKRQWVKKYLGDDVYMIPCIGGHRKYSYMHEIGDILIDDMYEKNCKPWVLAGGRAVHHPEGSDLTQTYNNVMRMITRL